MSVTTASLLEDLRRLSPRQRAVLVLRYFDDLTEADTAAALDTPWGRSGPTPATLWPASASSGQVKSRRRPRRRYATHSRRIAMPHRRCPWLSIAPRDKPLPQQVMGVRGTVFWIVGHRPLIGRTAHTTRNERAVGLAPWSELNSVTSRHDSRRRGNRP